jgi:hypothetical protein
LLVAVVFSFFQAPVNGAATYTSMGQRATRDHARWQRGEDAEGSPQVWARPISDTPGKENTFMGGKEDRGPERGKGEDNGLQSLQS